MSRIGLIYNLKHYLLFQDKSLSIRLIRPIYSFMHCVFRRSTCMLYIYWHSTSAYDPKVPLVGKITYTIDAIAIYYYLPETYITLIDDHYSIELIHSDYIHENRVKIQGDNTTITDCGYIRTNPRVVRFICRPITKSILDVFANI